MSSNDAAGVSPAGDPATPASAATATPEWHRVHRASPLLRFWLGLVAVLVALTVNLQEQALNWLAEGGYSDLSWPPSTRTLLLIGAVVGGLILLFLLVWGFSYLWWRVMGYAITEEEVKMKSGLISSTQRSARFDRIEAVDIVEKLVPRLLGLAAVRIETAGGSESAISIEFLTKEQAESLRAHLLALTSQHKGQPYTAQPAGVQNKHLDPAAEAIAAQIDPDLVVVPQVPIHRSLIVGLLPAVGLPLLFILLQAIEWRFEAAEHITSPILIPVLLGLIPAAWKIIDYSWHFQAYFDPNRRVLNVTHGAANVRRQAIHLNRVHAVTMILPLTWRLTPWRKVQMSVAGYGKPRKEATTVLLPVGPKDLALHAMSELGAAPITDGPYTMRPPRRARWCSPLSAGTEWVSYDPAQQKISTSEGFFTRRISTIQTSHIQELTYQQGPIQRLLKLADVRLDLVAGPVQMKARDMDEEQARQLLTLLRARELPERIGEPTPHRESPVDARPHTPPPPQN